MKNKLFYIMTLLLLKEQTAKMRNADDNSL